MNPATARQLGPDGVNEFWRLQQQLMSQLEPHSLGDGRDFYTRCTIRNIDGQHRILCDGTPIDGITSPRQDVIRALFNAASSQLGR